ncbi:MAG TPA: ABC-F family ATP-binding cassette domain-containing protein [Candidatus Polarisedimenticolia bacterium]|nr:ABC-F family ATP-binding cassette domain-containing protein [Candidatus Polarisedimenticolia bacterium]
MIRLQGVTKAYGVHEVLKGIDLGIPPRSRIGLVGPNGAGKTTILRLIASVEEPDRGTIDVTRGMALGYLPQEGARLAEGTVLDALLAPFAEVAVMERDLEQMHEEMATARGERLDTLIRRSGDLQHRFEAAGGFELESQAKAILGGLGFAPGDHARPLREFSGGYRMRAALGALLLRRPDFLLLDEPTNHLDLEAIAWLEAFLSDIPSALLIVSHDRTFLNRLVSSIAEVDRGRVVLWPGNYDQYRVAKEQARELALKKAASEAHRVEEVERFIERFRYKATKARQVQSRIKMLDKMERTEVMAEEHSWRFTFPNVPRSAQRVALLGGVCQSYGERAVLKGLDLEIWRGDRIALVGPNGCGKSTLLQVVAGRLPADAGTLEIGDKVVLHYFAQHVLETLTRGRTVLEEMQAWSPSKAPGQLRSLLGIFQFSGDDVFKKVEVLSGGEKNRLALARLTLDPGNFLLLDEPTNHLDLPTREALEDALAGFGGTLLFVSHDRYFINRVATRVAAFRDGRLALYDGGYDDYLAAERVGAAVKRPAAGPARQPARPEQGGGGAARDAAVKGRARSGPGRRQEPPAGPAEAHRPARGGGAGREQRRVEAETRNQRNRELRTFRDRVAALEAAILPHETRLKEIEATMAAGDTWKDPALARRLGEEKKSIEIELAHLYDDWDEATSDLQREEARLA